MERQRQRERERDRDNGRDARRKRRKREEARGKKLIEKTLIEKIKFRIEKIKKVGF